MTATETEPGLSLEVFAQLAASLGGLAAEVKAERRRKENLAADVAFIEAPPVTFTAVRPSPTRGGPTPGSTGRCSGSPCPGSGRPPTT